MDYPWGRAGDDALIHELSASRGLSPDRTQPAAELWMGAHPKAPARLPDGRPLDEAIRQNTAHFLGQDLADRGYRSLPFLFKILDAARPLSIQAHPDRDLAPELHARDPKNYPDDNHKPELAVSLGGMTALIGFREPAEIYAFLKAIPELRALCLPGDAIYEEESALPAAPGSSAPDEERRSYVRELYGQLMQSSPTEIEEAVRAHLLRLRSTGMPAGSETGDSARAPAGSTAAAHGLFAHLTELYGERDAGVFCVYFLNYVELEPGEGLFLGPNEPHAYLGGQILECMAASDNVVRAGLTAKYMDTATLLRMLHYRPGPPEIRRPIAHPEDPRRSSYKIEADDFQVLGLELSGDPCQLDGLSRPAIVLALHAPLDITARSNEQELARLSIPRGGVVLFPGDLAARGVTIELSGAQPGTAYLATVGPDF